MAEKSINKFFLSIVIPTVLAIVLFIVSFYVVIIPLFEESMMERKKEMLLELTNTAWSVLDEFNNEYANGLITREEAQGKAILQIKQMRYGNQQKDYFWIIDHQPKMIMHPYRNELNNVDLSNYKDNHENRLFVDAVKVVDSLNQGFVEYYWQWKDDTTRIVPKLSFVKGFAAWNWVIGTGIYLDDVSAEIKALKGRLLKLASLIVGFIMLILFYVVRQSLNIENKRKQAETSLKLSRQKYKSLVDASTEGTLMFLNGQVIFANQKFIKMYNSADETVLGFSFNDLFLTDWNALISKIADTNMSVTTETKIVNGLNHNLDVVISVSQINYADQIGYIVIVKNVGRREQMQMNTQKLSDELQISLQLMNQPIETLVKPIYYCQLNATIYEVALLMNQKKVGVVFVKSNNQVIGVINSNDIVNRVLAENKAAESYVAEVMSSPVVSIIINSLLYEAVLLFKNKHVSHLLVKNVEGSIVGYLSNQDCLEMQRNSLSYLIQQIERSQTVSELKVLYSQLPVLVHALISSSDNINNITRLISSVSDAITCRVIQFAIDEKGEAPCEFAFIAMGSEGRCEQTLKTDQDNAIVFADDNDECQAYFLQLANYINTNLNIIGYNTCKGMVMASNSKWCQPLNVWQNYFSKWINSPEPQSILDSSIFFDLKFIYGNLNFVMQLQAHIGNEVSKNGLFFYHLANSVIKYKAEVEKDIINLKKLLLPLVGYLRVLSLYYEINEKNSLLRLEKLLRKYVLSEDVKDEIENMYNFLVYQRIKNQVKLILNNETPINALNVNELTAIEFDAVKKIVKATLQLQDELSVRFKVDG